MKGSVRCHVPVASNAFFYSGLIFNILFALLLLAIAAGFLILIDFDLAGAVIAGAAIFLAVYFVNCCRVFCLAIARAKNVKFEFSDGKFLMRGCGQERQLEPDDIDAYYIYNGKIIFDLKDDHEIKQCYPFFRQRKKRMTLRTYLLSDKAALLRLLQDFDPDFPSKKKISIGMALEGLSF